jgi:hypothetical protein
LASAAALPDSVTDGPVGQVVIPDPCAHGATAGIPMRYHWL